MAQPSCGSALVSAVGVCADVGSRSVLLSRMSVFKVTGGAGSDARGLGLELWETRTQANKYTGGRVIFA